MKEIIINSMRFVNFKGLRDVTITFPSRNVDISADNGLGKTSIFDGFTWCLFGKDSKDRTAKLFNLKTLDEQGNAIPRLPHEVEINLTVDGQPVKLTHRYNEKWVRQRGSATEEFKCHDEERLYNDVPCTEKDWKVKIEELCSEQVFKFITNPMYFNQQSKAVQRDYLFRMIGGISDAEIAAGNVSFTKLLADMTGKTMDEYKREIACKKARLKKELADLPGRIDENKRKPLEPEDWAMLTAQKTKLIRERSDIEAQLTSSSEAQRAHGNKLVALHEHITQQKANINNRRFAVEQEAMSAYQTAVRDKNAIQYRIDTLLQNREEYEHRKRTAEAVAEECTSTREKLITEYRSLLAKSTELANIIETGAPEFNESEFKCPTCGHPYDYDQIEEIQAKALEQFRAKYRQQLATNAEAIEHNKSMGRANNERKQQQLAKAEEFAGNIAQIDAQLEALRNNPKYTADLAVPDTTPAVEADAMLKTLRADLEEQAAEYKRISAEAPQSDTNTAELKERYAQLSTEIDSINARLSKRQQIADNYARIAELEEALRRGNNELAELEGIEFTIMEFSKAKVNAVENKINSLFTIVRFKMFDTQVNGAEVETCEATVNGIPFSGLNDAGRINAGLDIINAICKFEDISAPIFIDAAESINNPLHTLSQRIRLIVSHDPELTVRAQENI